MEIKDVLRFFKGDKPAIESEQSIKKEDIFLAPRVKLVLIEFSILLIRTFDIGIYAINYIIW